MAKPFRFRYVNEIVGGFVMLVVALLVVGVILAGNAQEWFTPVHVVRISFPEAGSLGVQKGAAVMIMGTEVGRMAAEWADFFERFDMEKYGSEGAPLHDPTVIAYLLKPELFGGRDCNVEIETASPLTAGMTVVDWWQVTDRKHNARVMKDVDADGFFALLTERVGRL